MGKVQKYKVYKKVNQTPIVYGRSACEQNYRQKL